MKKGGIQIAYCINNNGNRSKEDIKELVDITIIKSLSREVVVERKEELRENKHYILKEIIADKFRISSVSFSPIKEEEISK